MSLVFAGYVPHPPLLVPELAKDHSIHLDKTVEALATIEKELYTSNPDMIFIISPHTGLHHESFTINANPHFEANFHDFGEMETSIIRDGLPQIAAKLSHEGSLEHIPIQLISEIHVDHGISVPLATLTRKLEKVPILPIGFSGMDPQSHLKFGQILKEYIASETKRVAVIAAGDLSHCHTKFAPGGFHVDSAEFDDQFIHCLETKNTSGIVHMDKQMISNAKECGYRVGVILLGLLQNVNYRFERLAYEKPHGVGYLTGIFHF